MKERVFSSWIVCGFYKIYNLNSFMVLTIVSVTSPFRLIFSWRCTKIFGQRIPILFPSKSIRCRNFEIFPTFQSFVYFSTFRNSAKDKSIAITQYCIFTIKTSNSNFLTLLRISYFRISK